VGRFLVSWFIVSLAILGAGVLVPGFTIGSFGDALSVALVLSLLNALLSPLLAAIRLPLPLISSFLLMLFANAYLLLIAEEVVGGGQRVESFWAALAASFVIAATVVVLEVLFGVNDESTFDAKVVRRVARRQGVIAPTDVPGLIFLEIDGLALPVLQRAMSDGSAPNLASWLSSGSHRLVEWETDLSSQTGASQAGILLGANANIPAFRWVEKETGRLRACSAPADCEELERERASGRGLLVNGGASRGNLLSGEADEAILTVSRMAAEVHANPGYRTFFSNAYNTARTLVLFGWEVILEWTAALRARRRNVQPRGHRGGLYPFMRAAMCVVVRDVIVFGVLSDMMRGKPAVYATFSSYDEVAHHSGLQRPDTLEALRKVDQAFGRIARARRFAPRPYEIVVLSDHGQTQGATFRQRNGISLEELVRQSLDPGASVVGGASGDETHSMVGNALDEATGRSNRAAEKQRRRERDVTGESAVVLGSGNLGLVYLMEERRRLTLEEIAQRHPRLLPALRSHPHIGWLLVRSATDGPVVLGASGARYLEDNRVEGLDPLAIFPGNAGRHLQRTDGFSNVADVMVGSFYDPMLDEGCAFEELISFHGGLGGSPDPAVHPVSDRLSRPRGADRRRRGRSRPVPRLARDAPGSGGDRAALCSRRRGARGEGLEAPRGQGRHDPVAARGPRAPGFGRRPHRRAERSDDRGRYGRRHGRGRRRSQPRRARARGRRRCRRALARSSLGTDRRGRPPGVQRRHRGSADAHPDWIGFLERPLSDRSRARHPHAALRGSERRVLRVAAGAGGSRRRSSAVTDAHGKAACSHVSGRCR